MSAPDPFALGGRQDDANAALDRLIAEYRSAYDAFGRDDEHTEEDDRLLDLMRSTLDKINAFRPTTLAGVMAAIRGERRGNLYEGDRVALDSRGGCCGLWGTNWLPVSGMAT